MAFLVWRFWRERDWDPGEAPGASSLAGALIDPLFGMHRLTALGHLPGAYTAVLQYFSNLSRTRSRFHASCKVKYHGSPAEALLSILQPYSEPQLHAQTLDTRDLTRAHEAQ